MKTLLYTCEHFLEITSAYSRRTFFLADLVYKMSTVNIVASYLTYDSKTSSTIANSVVYYNLDCCNSLYYYRPTSPIEIDSCGFKTLSHVSSPELLKSVIFLL